MAIELDDFVVREKGPGFLGTLKRPGGGVSTEISIGVPIDGVETEIPTLIPTLTEDETSLLLRGERPTGQIVSKAVAHAKERIAQGESPFAEADALNLDQFAVQPGEASTTVLLEDEGITVELPAGTAEETEDAVRNGVYRTVGGGSLGTLNEQGVAPGVNPGLNAFKGSVSFFARTPSIVATLVKEQALLIQRDSQIPAAAIAIREATGLTVKQLGNRDLATLLKMSQSVVGIPGFLDAVTYGRMVRTVVGKVAPEFPPALVAVTQRIQEANRAWLKNNRIEPDPGGVNEFFFNVGSGGSSMVTALGLLYATRNPALVAPLFGAIQKAAIFEEALEAGETLERAGELSNIAFVAEAALEGVGLEIFMNALRGSRPILRILLRTGTEGMQEALQQTAEEIIAKLGFNRPGTMEDMVQRIGMAAAVGVVVGGPASTVVTLAEQNGILGEFRKAGFSDKEARQVITQVVEKQQEAVAPEVIALVEQEVDEFAKAVPEAVPEAEPGVAGAPAAEPTPGAIPPVEGQEGAAEAVSPPSQDVARERLIRGTKLTPQERQDFPDLAAVEAELAVVEQARRDITIKGPDRARLEESLVRRRVNILAQAGIDIEGLPGTAGEQVSLIREKTQQFIRQAKTITESQALKQSMKRQEQAARTAARFTKARITETQQLLRRIKKADIQEITAEARVGINTLQQELKTTRTLEGLRELSVRIEAVKESGKVALQANKEARDAAFQLDRALLIATIQMQQKGKKLEAPPVTAAQAVRPRPLKVARAVSLRAPRLLDLLDGGQNFEGAFYVTFYDRANFGYNDEVEFTKEATVRGTEILQKHKITAKALSQTQTFQGVTLTLSEMMGLYVGMGNQETLAAFVFGNGVSISVIQDVVAWMPQNAKEAADEFAGELQANYSRTRLAMLDFTNGQTDLGQVKGAYFPMKRLDVNYQESDKELLEEFVNRQGLQKAFAERGFTKGRVKVPAQFQTPIRMGLTEVYFDHVAKREHFIHLARVIKDLQRLANDADVSEAIRLQHGQEFLTEMRNYVNRVANPNIYKSYGQIEKIMRASRQSAAVVHLGFNLITMLKQVPSVTLFLGEVSPAELLQGIGQMTFDWDGSLEFIHKRDPQLANRQIERELEEFKVTNPKQYERTIGQLTRASLEGIYVLDRFATHAGWLAKYNQMIRAGNTEEEAIRAAQAAVLRTQPAAAAKDIASLYATNEFVNLMTQFTNQLNQIHNIATYDIPMRARRGRVASAILGGVGLSLDFVLIWIMSHGRLPKDREDLSEAAMDTVIGSLPLFGPMINAWRHGFEGVPAALDLLVKKPAKAITLVVREPYKALVQGKGFDAEAFKEDIGKAFDQAGYIIAFKLKVPYTQIRRTIMGMTDLIQGTTGDLRRLIMSEFSLKEREKTGGRKFRK